MDFKNIIQDISSLPTLPQAYHQCCHLLELESTDSVALAAVISAEPAMAISVLRLVNSAFYNMPRKIERIDHAISIIGQQSFKQLILTAAIIKAVDSLAHGEIDIEVFWRHSIFTGLVARRLALHSYLPNCERLFIAGLLHDIGQVIYFDIKPQKSLQVCDLVKRYGIDITVAEHKVLGFDHQELGYELCKHWQLPTWLQQTILHHHSPQLASEYQAEASIIYLANYITAQYYPGLPSHEHKGPVTYNSSRNDLAWKAINLSEDVIEYVVEEATEQFEDVLNSLLPKVNIAV